MRVTHFEECPRCRSNGRDTRGDNLAIYLDGSKHCFSCGFHVFPAHYVRSTPRLNEHKTLLPTDFSGDIPSKCWQWLLQYGLSYQYWREQVGYSATDERLVFKVGDPLRFSIGRYFGTEDRRKWYVWGDSHKHCEVVGPVDGDALPIVLVEDLISAHKVGQVTRAIPIFGTALHSCHLYYLINTTNPVHIWLDKDQEDKVKHTAMRLGMLLGRTVNVITTDKDPKWLPLSTIKELTNGIQSLA